MSKKKKNDNVVRTKKLYTLSDMENCLKEVRKGTSVRSASKAFNVPYATLHSRVKGRYSMDVKPGPKSIFSKEEESELLKWIFHASQCGFPVTKENLLDSVQNIVLKTNRSTPFTKGRPSKHWYKAFLRRNPELSEKMYQNLTKRRASVTEESLRKWFAEIKVYLESKNLVNIGPERIFNLDESAFFLSPKGSKVLVRKGQKSVYNVCGNDKECYTALIAGNAAGQLAPSMIIYNNQRIPPLVAQHFPEEFVVGKSETGWMTSETFYMYIANAFYQWCVDKKIEFPIVLYVDGHSSHLTLSLSDFCHDHRIELIALFPNATHIMQPLDVALFRPLKLAYKDAIQAWRMKNNGQLLNKVFFPMVLKNALNSVETKKILPNGFKKCGLYPFSENAIDYSKLIQSNGKVDEDENISKEIATMSTFQDNISFIESNINSDVLQEFKNNAMNNAKWTGSVKYIELYYFWLRCKNKVPESENNFELIDIDKIPMDINSITEMDVAEVPTHKNDFIDVSMNYISDKSKIASTSELDGNCTVLQELILNEDGSTTEIQKNKNVNSIDTNRINTQTTNISLNKEFNGNRVATDIGDIVSLDKGFSGNGVHTDTAAMCSNKEFNENTVITDTAAVKQSNIIKDLKDTDVCNDIAVTEMVLDLTIDNRFSNRNSISINLNSNLENTETEEPTMIVVPSTENHTKSSSTNVKGSVSESPFKEYLFWPQNKLNDSKINKNKYRFPHVATAAEWRSWYKLKNEQKQKDEDRKAEMTLRRQNNIKIKQEVQENLVRIKTEKVRIQALLKELDSTLQRNKTEKKLLQLELKSELLKEKKLNLNQQIQNLEEKITENLIRKEELLQMKRNVIEEERNIKKQNTNKKSLTKKKNELASKENVNPN